MTEAEWLACENPERMGLFLRESAYPQPEPAPERMALLHRERASSLRKIRLYAVACCRRMALEFMAPVCAEAIELSERYADDEGVQFALQEAADAVSALSPIDPHAPLTQDYAFSAVVDATSRYEGLSSKLVSGGCAIAAIAMTAGEAVEETRYDEVHDAAQLVEEQTQSSLLRDIFGNPFRPVTFVAEWRTDTAVALARQMYESRDFNAMPILADALQDAGCDNADILSHCRGPGPHVRGCWVVDLVLGKG